MSLRAVVMFIIALILIRCAGIKTFGKTSAFDNVISIMMGAILSRGITGDKPFFDVVFATLAMVLMTRLFSYLSLISKSFGLLVKGHPTSLYKDGKFNEKELKKTLLSHSDVMENIRKEINCNTTDQVHEVFIETSGKLSVIKKN